MREADLEITTVKIAPLIGIPSRRTWGEAWWTARDICITNEPELPEYWQAIAEKVHNDMWMEFLFGKGPSLLTDPV